MTNIYSVKTVQAWLIQLPGPLEPQVAIAALGETNTTGWTHINLSPRFYLTPPADGFWDFDMVGDEPTGIVGDVIVPVAAGTIAYDPKWCTGVRVHAETNFVEAKVNAALKLKAANTSLKVMRAKAGNVVYHQNIASFDDSIQPTGQTMFNPWPHAQMKKLHHDLVLTVEGPDQNSITKCVNQALAAGLIAAIVAACVTGGAALPAAISALLSELIACLGNAFTARIDDQSHWEYWWT